MYHSVNTLQNVLKMLGTTVNALQANQVAVQDQLRALQTQFTSDGHDHPAAGGGCGGVGAEDLRSVVDGAIRSSPEVQAAIERAIRESPEVDGVIRAAVQRTMDSALAHVDARIDARARLTVEDELKRALDTRVIPLVHDAVKAAAVLPSLPAALPSSPAPLAVVAEEAAEPVAATGTGTGTAAAAASWDDVVINLRPTSPGPADPSSSSLVQPDAPAPSKAKSSGGSKKKKK